MTLLFVDGFDHYGTSDLSKKWVNVGGSEQIASTSGRRGGGALYAASYGQSIDKVITSSGTVIIGVAFKSATFNTGYPALFTLKESATVHLTVMYNAASKIEIRRGNTGGTLLATSTSAYTLSAWNYFELKAKIDSTTGMTEVHINGVVDSGLTLTGANTRNGGTSGVISTVQLGQSGGAGAWAYYDDLYVCNNSGSTNNDFLGDCRVDTILPTGDGNYTQFTPSTGTAHWSLVDENPPNTTDYVSSATSGDRDSYTFPDLSGLSSQTIYGIQINAAALKSDAGARSLGTMSRLGGTDKDGAGAAMSTSQLYISEIQETDPASAAWTESNVNAAEFGVKVTA